jgi:hypothetical protein
MWYGSQATVREGWFLRTVTVLTLLGFRPVHRSGAKWDEACPLHGSPSRHSRSFSVDAAIGRYDCHGRRSHGEQLDLCAAANNLPVYQAAIDSCRGLGRDVPSVWRW